MDGWAMAHPSRRRTIAPDAGVLTVSNEGNHPPVG
jgi:hypothetical protein